MASSERIFGLLDTPVELTDPAPGRLVPDRIDGVISFEGVWFAYRDDDYVLRDVSFSGPARRAGGRGRCDRRREDHC